MNNSYCRLVLLENPMFVFVDLLMKNFVERGRVDAVQKLLEFLLVSKRRVLRSSNAWKQLFSCMKRRAYADEEDEDREEAEEMSSQIHLARSLLFGGGFGRGIVVVYELSLDVYGLTN